MKARNGFMLALVAMAAACSETDSPVAPAQAPPLQSRLAGRELYPFDRKLTLKVCGFPIVRHDLGTLAYSFRMDTSGKLVFEAVTLTNWLISFTNPANGKMVTAHRAYTERFTYFDDGKLLAATAGLVANFIVPGEGVVAGNVGALRIWFDAEGNPLFDEFVVAGIHDGPIAAYVCPYLAD